MKIDKENEKLAKEAEKLFKDSFITRDDDLKIREIRQGFKLETEETMKTIYQEIKKKYLTAEIEYLTNIKKQRMGK